MNEAALFIWVRKSLQDILLAVKNVILNAMPFVFQHSHAKKKKKKSFAFCSQVSVYEGRYKVLNEKNKMIKHSSFREEGWNCGLICKVLGGCIQALFRFSF